MSHRPTGPLISGKYSGFSKQNLAKSDLNDVKSFAVSGTLSATSAAVRGTRLYMGTPLTSVSRRVGNTKTGGAILLVMELL
jgi:hypothetical protein